MKTLNYTLFIILIANSFIAFSKDNKIYFDKDWIETTKENAVYYRIIKNIDTIYYIEDYFAKKNQLQNKFYSKTKEEPFYFEGKAIWYYENGQLQRECFFINNLLNGFNIQYYINGQISLIGEYKNGLKNSEFKEFRFDGNLESMVNYEYDEANGNFILYNNNNNVISKGRAKNGVHHGYCEQYFCDDDENNTLKYQFNCIEGYIDGNFYEFSRNEDTIVIANFSKGIATYFKRYFDVNKNNYQEMQLVDGIEYWKLYNQGVLKFEGKYKNGYRIGEFKYYNDDGILYLNLNMDGCPYNEKYKIGIKSFIKNLSLPNRFELIYYEYNDIYNCSQEDVKLIFYDERLSQINKKIEDVYFYSKLYGNKKNYIEQIIEKDFIEKNNCIQNINYITCSKSFANVNYILVSSFNAKILDSLFNVYYNKINTNNIIFFLQINENNKYIYGMDKYVKILYPTAYSKSVIDGIELNVAYTYRNYFFNNVSTDVFSIYKIYSPYLVKKLVVQDED